MKKISTLIATALISSVFALNVFADTTSTETTEVTQNPNGSVTSTTVTETTTTDADITKKVKELFGPEMTAVMVETKDGVVILTGKLKTQADVERAINTARTVAGVKDVNSKIVLEEVVVPQ